MSNGRSFALAIALSLSFAIFTCFVSNNLNSRFEHRKETIEQQFSILKGQPYLFDGEVRYFASIQNRILFPAILNVLRIIGILSVSQWFLLLRLFTAFFAFLVFFYLLIKVGKVDYKTAAVGMLLLAYETIFTFNWGWENPTDFIDVIFISLFLWASLRHRRLALLSLAILASTNRESCVFAGVIWFFLYGIKEKFKLRVFEIFYAAAVSIISYGFVLLLRYGFGGGWIKEQQTIAWTDLLYRIKEFINYPSPSSWPVLLLAMFIPVILWIWSNRRFLSAQCIKLLAAAFAIVFISLIFGRIDELRIFLPSIVIIVFVATVAETKIKNYLGQ